MLYNYWSLSLDLYTGLKIDYASMTDSIEASSLGYKNNYIQVYSNSWGPNDKGFIVEKPGILLENALINAVKKVIMPRCTCGSEIYGSVFVGVSVCVCIDYYNCSMINEVQGRVSIGYRF